MGAAVPERKTILDAFRTGQGRNIYCELKDIKNEAGVETFFLAPLIKDLGYKNPQIRTKESIESLKVGRGHKIVNYKPDYVLFVDRKPRVVIDAKDPDESLDDWIEQCSGYCLALNRRFKDENPVRYLVLSNGKSTLLSLWDKETPLVELDFADFDWGNTKFQRFREILEPKAVVGEIQTLLTPKVIRDFEFTRATPEKAKQLFVACHRAIWKMEGSSPSAAFLEFTKLMFVKMWEDRRLRERDEFKADFASHAETVMLPAQSVIFSVRWIEEREEEGSLNPIDKDRFETLRAQIEREIALKHKKRIFEEGERIRLKAETIKEVVRKLEHYDLYGIDDDLNGRLFETFLSATMRGSELGQYFTPRSIVKMMALLTNLKAARDAQDRVIDACCGSGGFLIEALSIMRQQVRDNKSLTRKEFDDLIEKVAYQCVWGIDFGKDPPLARIARINMYLHGDGGSRIYYADALDKTMTRPLEDSDEVVENLKELHDDLSKLRFTAALTNPPFSMTKESKNSLEKVILEQYQLAHREEKSAGIRPSLRSSAMFLERYWDLLEPHGRLLTVIDDTVLASRNFDFVRIFIRSHFTIRAIVSLPAQAFKRSGARVKTSVLYLEKKAGDEPQPPCFGFFSERLGVDDLAPRARSWAIEEARRLAEEETKAIVEGFRSYMRGEKGEHVIPADRLKDRLDLKFCFPQFGRMAKKWQSQGVKVVQLSERMQEYRDSFNPHDYPEDKFTTIRVTYDGRVELEKVKRGKEISYDVMLRVKAGQFLLSEINATNGAVGIIPKEFDGAVVSQNYHVFDCGPLEETAYLWAVLRSHEVRADMQSVSSGTGRYRTSWPDIGVVPIPWLADEKRREVGKSILESWRLEKEAKATNDKALGVLASLELESEGSIRRWKANRAPT